MDERGGKQQTTEHTSHRMLKVAAALLIFSFLLFLVQLLNLNMFDVKASGMDSLPVSIRAGAQADYSGDPPDLAVPPISENILQQIINDIPATGSAQDRMGTLQVALSSPVPTMTPDGRFPATATTTPTLPAPTVTHIEIASNTPLATVTRSVSPTPSATYVYSSNDVALPTATKTLSPATRTSTPSRTPTATLTLTRTATLTATASSTLTNTPTSTLTVTSTFTPTVTSSTTSTYTPTFTPSPTASQTFTPTHTQ